MPAGSRAVQRFYTEQAAQGPQPAEPPPLPMVGVWDQWTVLSERFYSKEGDLSLHDEVVCRAFIENFRRSPDDLPCNIDHNKALDVGSYNAMALFVDGQCVDFATHDPSVQPPTLADLPGSDAGAPPDDGIYWRRARLTDIGLTAGPGKRKVSPEFYMRGKNQFGEEVGPLAVGGAWTNYPFLPGCEKHEFTKEPSMGKKMSFAERCYADAGCSKDDDEKQKFGKVTAYLRGKHGAEFAKFSEEAGVGKDDDEAMQMTKLMSYMAGKFGDHAEPDGDEGSLAAAKDGVQQMTGPSVTGTAPPVLDGGEPNKDPVAGPTSMTRDDGFAKFAKELGLPADPAAARARVQTYSQAAQALPELNRRLEALAAEQAKAKAKEAEVEAQAFTREAWGKGQIKPRSNEKHADAQKRILQLYTQSGRAAAEAALLEPGSYTPPEAMSTLLEFSRERPAMEAARPDDEVLRRATEKMKSAGIEPKTKGGVFDHRLSKFAREVCEEDRDLARRYANQSRMAQLEGLG